MAATIYGIKACDTMKKARAWLDGHGIEYAFHDYKTAGIDALTLQSWARQVGWEVLLNRSGTTFRGLADADSRSPTSRTWNSPNVRRATCRRSSTSR